MVASVLTERDGLDEVVYTRDGASGTTVSDNLDEHHSPQPNDETRRDQVNGSNGQPTCGISKTSPSTDSDKASDDSSKQEPNGITVEIPNGARKRRRVVVVGLGMVAIAFIEKLLKLDSKRNEYSILVMGEEPHPAYNRVGLTSFFNHRKTEDLYMRPKEWYESFGNERLKYYLNTRATEISPADKTVTTNTGITVSYDTLVLATGSDANLPLDTPGHDANGVFVYRTIDDLQGIVRFAASRKGGVGVAIGGGLLGLESAKAMLDLGDFSGVTVVDRSQWVLARQVDGDAGTMVTEKIRKLGLKVLLGKSVGKIEVDGNNDVVGIAFRDGERIDCSCICFAIGIKPRDELGHVEGLKLANGGGFAVNDSLETSLPGVYAIGECASWDSRTYGLIAPGVEMADVLAFNLTQAKSHSPRVFKRPDMSTKLKLLGVEVASFGDYFADRDGPASLPGGGRRNRKVTSPSLESEPMVRALTYRDPFGEIYKKYIFTADGKYLLGGIIIGDTRDYIKLLQLVKGQKPLEISPGELIVASQAGSEGDADDLPDDTQVCSCYNVSKGDIVECVKIGSCKSVGEVKSCTKAGTGCGGCVPLVQTIFSKTMKDMGQTDSNNLCPHFEFSRVDLYNIIAVKQLKTFVDVMRDCGKRSDALGCEVCKPAVASILSSIFNPNILDRTYHDLQDTNDKFLANIQRNGTFSVVPRVAGGEITPEKLIIIGQVAKRHGLYCKITGGQRIDMFGARKQDLLSIWAELVAAGMESGHAYAKSLRTVKSCVGSTWCRFGIGDSVGMAILLEERYKSIRGPHKIKGGVSGCVRECAEAQGKDFGLIATEKGFNIFVGGNGGAKPRHAELLAKDVPPEEVVPVLDRYLILYIRTADRLQRTARWIESLPGGIKYLREVIMDDKLGICADLEKQMHALVGSYFCEWTEALKTADRRNIFRQFANTDDTTENVEVISERGQRRPADWAKDSATHDFRGTKWRSLTWQPVLLASHFADASPKMSSANVKVGDTQLAIFKVHGQYYATQQMCPHKRAFVLSDGLVGEDDKGTCWVSCPHHKRNFELNGDQAGHCSNDETLSVATFPAEEREDGWIYLKLPPVQELELVLGTERWKVRREDSMKPCEISDKKYKGKKGRRPGETGCEKQASFNGLDW